MQQIFHYFLKRDSTVPINRGVLFGTGYRKIAEKIKELMGEKEEYKDFKSKYKDFSNEMFVLNFFEQSSLTKKHEIKFVRPELDLTYYFHEFSDSRAEKDNSLEKFKSGFQKFLQEKRESSASAPDSKKLQTILDNYNDLIEKFLDETTTSQDYFATGSNYFNTETERGRKTVLKLNELQELKKGKKSSPFEAATINASYPYLPDAVKELNRQEPDIVRGATHFFAPFVNGIKSLFVECSENVRGFIWNHTSTHFHEAVDKIPSLQRDVVGNVKLAMTPDLKAPDGTIMPDPIEDHSSLSHIAPTEHHASLSNIAPTEHHASLQDLSESIVGIVPAHPVGAPVFCAIIDELARFMGPVAFGAKVGADITDAIIECIDNRDRKYTNAEKFTGKMAGGVAGAVVGGGGLAAVTHFAPAAAVVAHLAPAAAAVVAHLAPAAAAVVAPLAPAAAAVVAPLAAAGVVGYHLGQLVYDLSDRTQENDNNENAKLERLCFGLAGAGVGIGSTAIVFGGAFLLCGGATAVGAAAAVATPVIASIGLGVGAVRLGMLAYDNSPYSYKDVRTGIENMYQLDFADNLENNCSLIASKIADSCSQAASKISDTLSEKINGPDYKDQISREAIDLFNLAYPTTILNTPSRENRKEEKFKEALNDILAGKTQSDAIDHFIKNDNKATRGNAILQMILGRTNAIGGKKPQEILQEIIIKNTDFRQGRAIEKFFKELSAHKKLEKTITNLKEAYHDKDFVKNINNLLEQPEAKELAKKYKIEEKIHELKKVIDKIEKFKENAEQNLRSKTIDGAIQHAITNNDIPNLSKLLASFSPESANELYRRIMFSVIDNKPEILGQLALLHSGIQPNSCLFPNKANALQGQKQASATAVAA